MIVILAVEMLTSSENLCETFFAISFSTFVENFKLFALS